MKILKDKSLKDNQMVKMTLKKFKGQSQQDSNDPGSTLIAIE